MSKNCVRMASAPLRRSSRVRKKNVCSMFEYGKICLSSKKDRIPVSLDRQNMMTSTDDEVHRNSTKMSRCASGQTQQEERNKTPCCPESSKAAIVNAASQAVSGGQFGSYQQDVAMGSRNQKLVTASAREQQDVVPDAREQQNVVPGSKKQQSHVKEQHDVAPGARELRGVVAGATEQRGGTAGVTEQLDVASGAREQQDVAADVREQLSVVAGCREQVAKKYMEQHSDGSDSPTMVTPGCEKSSTRTSCILQNKKSDITHENNGEYLNESFVPLNERQVPKVPSRAEHFMKTRLRSLEDESDHDDSFPIRKGTLKFWRKRSGRKKYFCSFCGKGFINQCLLVTHERCHSGEKPYACSICGKSFALKSNMHQHEQLHSEDRRFMCEICGKCFKTQPYYKEHSKTHQVVKSFKCEVSDCDKTFASKTNYKAHMLFHKGEKPYDCKDCHKAFRRKQALRKHSLIHSGLEKFECLSCGKVFVHQDAYHAHIKLHDKKPFTCGVCKKFFASENERESHQVLHTRYPFYSCEFCHRSGMHFQELSKHLKKHGLQFLSNIKCPNCRRSFATQNIFNQHTAVMSLKCSACVMPLNSACMYYSHRNSHRNDRNVQHDHIFGHVCDICGKDFQKMSLLKNHKLIHGETRFRCDTCGKESKTKPCHMAHVKTHSGLKPFCCEICGKYFVSLTNLQNHQLIHTGEKPHGCLICHKSFRTRAMLREHGNVHCNEKHFKCEQCGKEYTSRTNYINHLNVHKGQRNYECELCGKKFFAKYVMRKHMQIHTGQKNYQCDFCGKKFIQHGNWLIHRRSHTGERPHRCEQCPAGFVNSSQLKSHRRRVHDMKKEEMCDKCFKHFYDRKGLLSHMKNIHVRKENGEIFSCNECGKLFVFKENYCAHAGVCKVSQKPFPSLQPSILQRVLRTVYSKASVSSCGEKGDTGSNQTGQLLQEKDFLFQFESLTARKDKGLEDQGREHCHTSLQQAIQQFQIHSLPCVEDNSDGLTGENIEIIEISESVIEADLSNPKVEMRDENTSVAAVVIGDVVRGTDIGGTEMREGVSVAAIDISEVVADTKITGTEMSAEASVAAVDIGEVVDTDKDEAEGREKAYIAVVDTGEVIVDADIDVTEVEVSDALMQSTRPETEVTLESVVPESTVQPLQRALAEKCPENGRSVHVAHSEKSMGNANTESLYPLDHFDIVNESKHRPTTEETGTKFVQETNDTESTGSCGGAVKVTKPTASWIMREGSSMFQCSLCKKVLISQREARLHEKVHQAHLLYQCSPCGARFGTAATLTNHLQAHCQVQGHPKNTVIDGGRSGDIHEGCLSEISRIQTYFCDVCNKRFSFFGLYRLHTDSHRLSCCFKCYKCGQIFQDRRRFECHIQSHSQKRYKCKACGKMFSMKVVLKIHQKSPCGHGFSPACQKPYPKDVPESNSYL